MNNQNKTPAVICPQCRQQSGQTQREYEQRQDVVLSKRCFDSHPWFSRARIPGKIWLWTVQTEHLMSCHVMQIMQIRRMRTKCSASKLTYLFILKQWYLLHEFPVFSSPFYFFMRIKRFDLKKSRQNSITVAYKEAQCNSVTQWTTTFQQQGDQHKLMYFAEIKRKRKKQINHIVSSRWRTTALIQFSMDDRKRGWHLYFSSGSVGMIFRHKIVSFCVSNWNSDSVANENQP